MKKFINSQSSDTDSGRFSGGATSSDSSFRVQDINSALFIKIFVTPLSKQVYVSVSSKALVNHVRQKLLDVFGSQITDSINCGLFVPPSNGRNGKFLEEDRPISAYITDESTSNIEFTHKRRLCAPTPINLSTGDKSKNIPQSFLRAVTRGDYKKVEKYLSKGFDPNFVCPRTGAVGRPRPLEMIKTLIAGGAHKDFRIRNGLTALHKAAAIGNFEAVKALLDFGQSPNILDANGSTPLYHNILGDVDTRICHRLLYEYAQIEIFDSDGKQEIHQAALLGRTDQINLLIMYGADVNARSLPRPQLDPPGLPALPTRSTSRSHQQGGPFNGGQSQLYRIIGSGRETPLHYAAIAGQCATARRLLYWGADPSLTNDNGLTPLEEALHWSNHEVAEIIRNFRVGVAGSEGSICSPFLPAPTYNQKRKPMSAPLQTSSLDQYVTLTELGVERRGPSRSVTMPFPVSPSRNHAAAVGTDARLHQRNLSPSPTPPLSPLCRLTSRACSEGDLMRSLEEERKNSDGKGDIIEVERERIVQSSRERHNPRRVRRQKIGRGLTEVVGTTDRCPASNQNRRPLRSWKSLHTLNEDSTLESEEVLDEVPALPKRRSPMRLTSLQVGEASAMALSRFRTAPVSKFSPERPWSSQEVSVTAAHLSKGETTSTRQSTAGRGSAPVPANPFATTAPRPASPRQRDSHHFPRSPVASPDRKCACSPAGRTAAPIAGDRGDKGDIGITRTVTLHKAYLSDAPRVPTFGLSLRTVQNLSAVQRFVPTSTKPSLQLIRHVKPGSPAFKAGLREGDYVTKINHVDVARACHSEVVRLLDTLKSNTVVLEVTRPVYGQQCSGHGERCVDSRHSIMAGGGSASAGTTLVQRSVSMAGRVGHNNGPAPYSPMLPMHAPPHSQCVSPERTSNSSIDEAFCSPSGSRSSPRRVSPQVVDRRNSGREPPPRVHTAADYRIRHKFPGSKYTEPIRQGQLFGRSNLRQLPKSHTINSFTEDIGVDTSSLNSSSGISGSLSFSQCHTSISCYTNTSTSGRPVHSVPQPPLRFLPHYSSPVRRGTETTAPYRRHRGNRQFSGNLRPLSVTGESGAFGPGRQPGGGGSVSMAACPRSFSAMSANTPPPGQVGTFDPSELVLPPPEEFCC